MRKNKQQKKPRTTSIRFVSCHLCLNPTNEYTECSINRCKTYYCFTCILEKLDKDFKYQNYIKAKSCWICYSCGGSCKCLLCTGIDRNRKKRKPKPQNRSPSPKSSKKDQNQNPDPQQNVQLQESSKKKIIYSRRRLPVKKNVAFKYKTKRRSKGKSSIDVKSLLDNIKPEDKIFKIKRNQNEDASESQSQSILQESQNSMNQQQQEHSASVNKEKEESRQQKQMAEPRQMMNLNEVKKTDEKIRLKQSENNSSSLNYLGEKSNKQQKNESDPNKTKAIRKSNRLSKLPTIKSVNSNKQGAISLSKIKPGEKSQSGLKSESQSFSDDIQQEKRESNRRMSRKGRSSRSRTRGVRRRSQFKLKKSDISQSEQEDDDSEKQKPRRGRRRLRIVQQQQQKPIRNQVINKKPISSRQAKQLRELMQSSLQGPRRRSQKNYVDIQQLVEERLMELKENQDEAEAISIKLESLSAKQNQNDSLNSGQGSQINMQNQDPELRQAKPRNNDLNEIQISEDGEEDISKKLKRNSMVKKHYFEELQKNKQFQVDSSHSDQSQPNQQENQKPIESSDPQAQQPQIQTENNHQINPISQPQKQELPLKEKLQKPQQKSNLTKSPEKPFNNAPVYRKSAHHKKTLPQGSEVAHRGAQKNAIMNKWRAIQDNNLVDIKNIRKLGIQALFARQNLSKQMNDLVRRRNALIQKAKLQSQISKEVINVSTC